VSLKLYGPKPIFDAQAVSGTTVYRSETIDMLCMDVAAVELEWTGNAIGALSVDGSINGSTWYPTGQAVTDPTGAGAADNSLMNLNGIGFRYLSVSYTNASGAGTLTATAMAKGIGG
jgi:hypothetical protein